LHLQVANGPVVFGMFSMLLEKDGYPWLPKYQTQLRQVHLPQLVALLRKQQASKLKRQQ
jgi:hypothetical protein